MNAKQRFKALELMCREHARIASEDKRYWLNEAEEWARFAAHADHMVDSPPLQLDLPDHDDQLPVPRRATGA